MKLLVSSIAALFVFSGTLTGASAQSKAIVGIVVSDAINIPKGEALEIGDELASVLEARLEVGTVAASISSQSLPAEGMRPGCLNEVDCLKDIGNRLNVNELLVLVLVRVGTQTQVDATWVEITNGGTSPRKSFGFEGGLEAARAAFGKHARKLLPGARERGNVETRIVVADPKKQPEPDQVKEPLGPVFWTTAGIAVASVATWTVVGLVREQDDENADHLPLDIVMGSITGVASAAAIYFFFGRDEVSETTPRVGAQAGSSSFGLTLSGRF